MTPKMKYCSVVYIEMEPELRLDVLPITDYGAKFFLFLPPEIYGGR